MECAEDEDSAVVRSLRTLSVRTLDDSLPEQPFADWVRALLPKTASICWEQNDCGEQTGDPAVDRLRDLPACAEMWATIPPASCLSVLVGFGTVAHPRLQAPALRSITLEVEGVSQQLEDLAALGEIDFGSAAGAAGP